jgi:hypothetical protein
MQHINKTERTDQSPIIRPHFCNPDRSVNRRGFEQSLKCFERGSEAVVNLHLNLSLPVSGASRSNECADTTANIHCAMTFG